MDSEVEQARQERRERLGQHIPDGESLDELEESQKQEDLQQEREERRERAGHRVPEGS